MPINVQTLAMMQLSTAIVEHRRVCVNRALLVKRAKKTFVRPHVVESTVSAYPRFWEDNYQLTMPRVSVTRDGQARCVIRIPVEL